MKISKLFHWLYFTLLVLPVLVIPIFAVYSHRHDIEGNQAEVTESIKVNYNQIFDASNVNSDMVSYVDGYSMVWTEDFIIPSTNRNIFDDYDFFTLNHKYYVRNVFLEPFTTATPRIYFNGSYTLMSDNTYTDFIFSATDRRFALGFSSAYSERPFENHSTLNIYDLTLMGLENITIEDFDYYFPHPSNYILNQDYWIENYRIVTFDYSDIMSQFSYSIYNATENYLNLDNFFALGDIHTWLVNNFFGGLPSIYFTIAWHFLTYWFVVSIFWLIFDVLMYVPNLAHRWLDRGALE